MVKLNLRVLMAKKEVNQKQLYTDTGINKDTINRYYNNTFKSISPKHIEILCRYFKCEIQDLIKVNIYNK